MSTAVALIVIVVVAAGGRRRRGGRTGGDAWLWLLAEIEARVEDPGVRPAEATVGVCLHGPPQVRVATHAVVRDHAGARAVDMLAPLSDALATGRGDRLCGTVAELERTGVPPVAPLARLRAAEASAADHDRCRRAITRIGVVGRCLLLTPLVAVPAGAVTGAATWLLAGLAVGVWWFTGWWLRAATDPYRVLTTTSAGRTPAVRPGATA